MSGIFFAPHNDDETLFGAFSLIANPDAHVVVCYQSFLQAPGVTYEERQVETSLALGELGHTGGFTQLLFRDDGEYDDDVIESALLNELMVRFPGPVWAPYEARGGHPQHNQIGRVVAKLVEPQRLVRYMTYQFGGPKHELGVQVEYQPEWLLRKLRALSCYRSQILRGPHRIFAWDLLEWRAK